MTIFADSSALVSLFNPLDSNHILAKVIAQKSKIKNCLISKYIFGETVTILSQKVGKQKSVRAGELMKKNFRMVEITEDLEQLAWEIFKKQKSKNVSYVDCTTMAIYQKQIFDKLFAFDNDFKSNKIPLLTNIF